MGLVSLLATGALLFSGISIRSYEMTCTLTVYVSDDAQGSSFYSGGHAFISIRNNSMISLSGGYMPIKPLEEITIGNWGNLSQHSGVWYNLESYRANEFTSNVTVSCTFGIASLGSVNTYIINQNDGWSISNNCATFAAGVWSIVSNDSLNVGFFSPVADLYASVSSKSYCVDDLSVPSNSTVGYYTTPGPTFIADTGSGGSSSGSSSHQGEES